MGSQQNNSDSRTVKYEKFQRNLLTAVLRFDDTTHALDEDMVYVQSITFKTPNEERSGWMVVMRATTEGKQVVGFHNADTFAEALKGTIDRLTNRSIKWKADAYAQ